MTMLPVAPRLDGYTGNDERRRRRAAQHNAMAQRVADHINDRCANDPSEIQQYSYALIAHELRLTEGQVRAAVPYGDHNRITFHIGEDERRKLASYKRG
jgi:hypothetical protein